MKETQETSGISYDQIAYIPDGRFSVIGKNLNLPFSAVFALGKFGNLLMYVIVMFWAIRLAKNRKLLLAFVAMLPTPLFLASSYTYDSVVFSFITLGCVLWSREAFFPVNEVLSYSFCDRSNIYDVRRMSLKSSLYSTGIADASAAAVL